MNVSIEPALAEFIDEQIKSGRFSSRSDVVEAGVARLMIDQEADVLDEKDVNDIRNSIEQMNRGNIVSADSLHSRLRKNQSNK